MNRPTCERIINRSRKQPRKRPFKTTIKTKTAELRSRVFSRPKPRSDRSNGCCLVFGTAALC